MNLTDRSSLLGFLLLLVITVAACSPKGQIRPGDTLDVAFVKAKALYAKGKYGDAARAFETVLSLGRGSDTAEEAQFLLADSYFNNKEYLISAAEFKRFSTFYPRSEKRMEADFMEAYSYYKISPRYKLDQTDTQRALELFRSFINRYPDGERTVEAGKILDELRDKLALKSIKAAEMYYNLKFYLSAALYYQYTVDKYPETSYAEQAQAEQILCYVLYADNSVEDKQAERYQMAIDAYETYIQLFPSGKNRSKAEDYVKSARQGLAKSKSPAPQASSES